MYKVLLFDFRFRLPGKKCVQTKSNRKLNFSKFQNRTESETIKTESNNLIWFGLVWFSVWDQTVYTPNSKLWCRTARTGIASTAHLRTNVLSLWHGRLVLPDCFLYISDPQLVDSQWDTSCYNTVVSRFNMRWVAHENVWASILRSKFTRSDIRMLRWCSRIMESYTRVLSLFVNLLRSNKRWDFKFLCCRSWVLKNPLMIFAD